MPQRTRRSRPDPKVEALRVDGALNRHADHITDPVFGAHQFFDARDLVQVKYEMLRRVEIDASVELFGRLRRQMQALAPT